MGKVIVSTACLIWHNGKVLLAKRLSKHFNGYYAAAGGKLEYGESPTECIRREVQEETGIILDQVYPIPYVVNHFKGDNQYVLFWFFGFPNQRQELENITHIELDKHGNPKTEKWEWYSPLELMKLKLMPSILPACRYKFSTPLTIQTFEQPSSETRKDNR